MLDRQLAQVWVRVDRELPEDAVRQRGGRLRGRERQARPAAGRSRRCSCPAASRRAPPFAIEKPAARRHPITASWGRSVAGPAVAPDSINPIARGWRAEDLAGRDERAVASRSANPSPSWLLEPSAPVRPPIGTRGAARRARGRRSRRSVTRLRRGGTIVSADSGVRWSMPWCGRPRLKWPTYSARIRPRCRSPRIRTWSTHSRRTLPEEALADGVGPRRPDRRADHLDRAGGGDAGEGATVLGVVVVDQEPRSDALRRRLAELLRDPGVGRRAGDADVDHPPGPRARR